MLLEIKISKAGTDTVVNHTMHMVDCGRISVARAAVAEIIESVTNYSLDTDDVADINGFDEGSPLASRFGSDWEYFVEAVFLGYDEIDFDPEFDSISPKLFVL